MEEYNAHIIEATGYDETFIEPASEIPAIQNQAATTSLGDLDALAKLKAQMEDAAEEPKKAAKKTTKKAAAKKETPAVKEAPVAEAPATEEPAAEAPAVEEAPAAPEAPAAETTETPAAE